jgi:hypothetical protein
MDLVFGISGHRKIPETEVVNSYTHRQAMLLAEHLVRDKFAVASEVLSAFGGKEPSDPAKDSPPTKATRKRGLPSWYRARPGSRVIDLDGPMSELAPFLGKSALRRGGAKPARRR